MTIDLIAVAAVTVWAVVGWRRGFLAMGLWLVAFGLGLAAVVGLRRPAGELLAGVAPLPPMVSHALASVVLFVGVAAVVRLAGRGLIRRRRERVDRGWEPPALDRLGGAAVGACTAAAVVLALAWGGSTLAELGGPDPVALDGEAAEDRRDPDGARGEDRVSGAVEGRDDIDIDDGGVPAAGGDGSTVHGSDGPGLGSALRRSVVGRLGTSAAERSVEAAVRAGGGTDRAAATTAAIMARPVEARAALRTLAGRVSVRRLVADDEFREAFYRGDADALASHPGVVELLADDQVRAALGNLQVVRVDGSSPEAMARELAAAVAPVGGAVEELRGDPEFVAALERSRLQERLRSGDVAGLAGDRDVVWMMGRLRGVLTETR